MRRVTSIIVAFVAGLFIAANVAMFYELMKRDEVRTLKELIKKQNHHIEELQNQLDQVVYSHPNLKSLPATPLVADATTDEKLLQAQAALQVCNELTDELLARLKIQSEKTGTLDQALPGWNMLDSEDSLIGCKIELQMFRRDMTGATQELGRSGPGGCGGGAELKVLHARVGRCEAMLEAREADLAEIRHQRDEVRDGLRSCAVGMARHTDSTDADRDSLDYERANARRVESSRAWLRLVERATDPPTLAPTAEPTESPTNAPTARPTRVPVPRPTRAPTHAPTARPIPIAHSALGDGLGPSAKMMKYGATTGVLVLCYNRPEYLQRALDKVIATRPSDALFPIFVSQDGSDEAVENVIDTYRSKVTHIQHHDDRPVVTTRPKENPAYFKIARHYGWALDQVFEHPEIERLIILEDDLEVAADFFHYMAAGAWLLDEDPSIWCVSAWNDNGQPEFVKDPSALHRSDFFPGLGWMIKKEIWTEIGSRWPRETGYWDDWMRLPNVRKDRVCIHPEVSRTYTFGAKGVSHGQFFHKFLEKIRLNQDVVKFDELDLTYLTKVVYDTEFRKSVFLAKKVYFDVDKLQEEEDGARSLRVEYSSLKDFESMSKQIGIMGDEKAGVLRTGYQGVVVFWWGRNKRNHIMLVPSSFS